MLLLLLLLKLVVESLELVVLRVTMTRMSVRAMTTVALCTRKHIIDVLSQADFRTESIH